MSLASFNNKKHKYQENQNFAQASVMKTNPIEDKDSGGGLRMMYEVLIVWAGTEVK